MDMRSVLTSQKTVLELSEQFNDRFRTVLEPVLLTVLAVEPTPLVEQALLELRVELS